MSGQTPHGHTARAVARAVVAHPMVDGRYWADGPGRAHWMALWKVPAARERQARNDAAWERFQQLLVDLEHPERLAGLNLDLIDREAARLRPVIRTLDREENVPIPNALSGWSLRRAAAILGATYRNLDRRDRSGGANAAEDGA